MLTFAYSHRAARGASELRGVYSWPDHCVNQAVGPPDRSQANHLAALLAILVWAAPTWSISGYPAPAEPVPPY